jgi:hypothetical protein
MQSAGGNGEPLAQLSARCGSGCGCSVFVLPAVSVIGGRMVLADGVARGDFQATDPATAAGAVFDATTRFHNPAHAPEWQAPGIETELDAVCTLLLNGLQAR